MDGDGREVNPRPGFRPLPKPQRPAARRTSGRMESLRPSVDPYSGEPREADTYQNRQDEDILSVDSRPGRQDEGARWPDGRSNRPTDPYDGSHDLPPGGGHTYGERPHGPAPQNPQSRAHGSTARRGLSNRGFTDRRAVGRASRVGYNPRRGLLSSRFKRMAALYGSAAVAVLLLALGIWFFSRHNAYAVMLDGGVVTYVPYDETFTEEAMRNAALVRLEEYAGAQVRVNETVTMQTARASGADIVPVAEAAEALARAFTYQIAACAVTVDGEEVIVLRTEADAQTVADRLMAPYKQKDVTYLDASFVEDWQVSQKLADDADLGTVEEALGILDRTTRALTDYTVQPGDVLYTIAQAHGTTVANICENNPGLTTATVLQPGDVYKLETVKPLLSVRTVEEVKRTETVPLSVRQEENPLEYKTYTRTITEGKDGEREVTVRITRVNGLQLGPEEVIGQRTVVPPVDRVVEVGTSETPPERRTNG